MAPKIGEVVGTVEALNDLPVGSVICSESDLRLSDIEDIARRWVKVSPREWQMHRYEDPDGYILNVDTDPGGARNLSAWSIHSGPYVITEEPEVDDDVQDR